MGEWCDSTSGMMSSSTTTHGLRIDAGAHATQDIATQRRSTTPSSPSTSSPTSTTTRMLVMRGLAGAFTRVHSHHRVVSMLSTTLLRPSPLASLSSPRLSSTLCTNSIQQQQNFSTTTGGNGAGGYDLL